MIFNTWTFGLFVMVFFIIYWFLLKAEWRPAALLAASLVFYTYYFPAYTLLIGALALFVYTCGLLIGKYRGSHPGTSLKNPVIILWISVVACVLVLGYYKYLKMMIATFNDVLKLSGSGKSFAIPEILVPLGLSFFIFEFIHYLVDSYHGRTKSASILEFGVFAMFFPTLVAGPIKRFQPFINQLREKRGFKTDYLSYGVKRIMTGLVKKILIADLISAYTTPLVNYTHGSSASPLILWLSVYAYAIKIYFDFSGYSDIAIGCATLFGYEVPENFNKPYLKQNIGEFWRTWHMSLSNWLRDYIYMPVGKKLMPTVGRKSPILLAAICQFITMGICGLWHGASWNFVAWGLYHGAGLTVHKAFADLRMKRLRAGQKQEEPELTESRSVMAALAGHLKKPVFTFITFNFVCIGWVFFVQNIGNSIEIIGKMLFISKFAEVIFR